MTPKFTLITAVAGAALFLAVPAWGQVSPDVVDRAVAQREASTQWQQSTTTISPDVIDRAVAAKIASQSVPQPNPRGMLASDSVESAREQAIAAQPFNLRNVLASDSVEAGLATGPTSVDRRLVGDNYREPPTPVSRPTAIAASDSGREIEWPQIGMGFGLGILLAFGLFLAMRYTRIRTLAH